MKKIDGLEIWEWRRFSRVTLRMDKRMGIRPNNYRNITAEQEKVIEKELVRRHLMEALSLHTVRTIYYWTDIVYH